MGGTGKSLEHRRDGKGAGGVSACAHWFYFVSPNGTAQCQDCPHSWTVK